MDLDGTSVHSESFWMWVIEQTTARLLGDTSFKKEAEDDPYISGHSVSEHLQYMIDKYVPGGALAEARLQELAEKLRELADFAES